MKFKKKAVRKELVKTYVTIEEKAFLYDFFERQGVSISDGVRQLLLAAVKEMERVNNDENS